MGVLWSDLILFGMGMFPKVVSKIKLSSESSYIFVANHVSMIDIMLMGSTIRNHPIVFIGKKELEKIPFFGYVYKKTMIASIMIYNSEIIIMDISTWNCSIL